MISLYDLSVPNYRRVLDASIRIMHKAKEYFEDSDQDLGDIVTMQLAADMLPFSFQINSVRHHSLHALQGVIKGEFAPPAPLAETDYEGLIALLEKARQDLDEINADEINECFGKPVTFKMGSMELPFTAENFIMSFSIPNLYFHATTTYDMLRIKGAQLGKADFMGRMKIGV